MSMGYRVINFKVIHGSWILVHHHRVGGGGGGGTAAAGVGLGADFVNPFMEDILSCGVPRTLNTISDTTYKLNTGVSDASQ